MSSLSSFLPGPGIPGLVSVIIPAYNRRDLIAATLDSAVAQTYASFEAIVVDDGSTDGTGDVVARYRDERIRYMYKQNGGLSAARNSGLDIARGEFIAFLDSDDIWLPWKLSAQVALFRRHADVGMSWSDMSTFSVPGEVMAERFLRTHYAAYGQIAIESLCRRAGALRDLDAAAPRHLLDAPYYVGELFDQMFLGNLVHPPTAIVRRERLQQSGPFEPHVTGNGGEDHHFYYRIFERGPVALLDAPTILYRMHPTQQSRVHRLSEARADVRVVQHWLRRRAPRLPSAVIRHRVAMSHRWAGFEELHAGDRSAATRHLWNSLRREPSRQTALLLAQSLLPRRAIGAAKWARDHLRTTGLGLWLRLAGVSGLLYILVRLLCFEPELIEA